MFPRFYSKLVENPVKSAEAGRSIFDEVEMVEITLPGDRFYQPHFPALEPAYTYDSVNKIADNRPWSERFPAQYQAFKAQTAPVESGTPLDEWGSISRSQAAELKALGIMTVEMLAGVNDRNRAILGPGARDLIARAQAYLEAAMDAAPLNALAAKNAALEAELEALKARLDGFAEPEAEDGFDAMTVDQLKAFLDERAIDYRSNASRASLLALARAV